MDPTTAPTRTPVFEELELELGFPFPLPFPLLVVSQVDRLSSRRTNRIGLAGGGRVEMFNVG